MKKIVLLGLLFSGFLGSAQKDTIWFDKDWKPIPGKKSAAFFRPPVSESNGKFLIRDFYADGTPQMEGYSKTKTAPENWVGEVRYFNINGEVRQSVVYAEDSKTQKVTNFYNNGKMESRYASANGKPEGLYEAFYESGLPYFKVNMAHGLREGKLVQYYQNGKILSEVNYVNGQHEGTERQYYANGKLQFEGHSRNDRPNGAYIEYFAEGGVKAKGIYVDGKKTKWQLYDGNGKTLPAGTVFKQMIPSDVEVAQDFETTGDENGIVIRSNTFPNAEFASKSELVDGIRVTFYISDEAEPLKKIAKGFVPRKNEIVAFVQRVPKDGTLADYFQLRLGRAIKASVKENSLELRQINRFLIEKLEKEANASVALWSGNMLEKEAGKP